MNYDILDAKAKHMYTKRVLLQEVWCVGEEI